MTELECLEQERRYAERRYLETGEGEHLRRILRLQAEITELIGRMEERERERERERFA